jgi:hypothetical protein
VCDDRLAEIRASKLDLGRRQAETAPEDLAQRALPRHVATLSRRERCVSCALALVRREQRVQAADLRLGRVERHDPDLDGFWHVAEPSTRTAPAARAPRAAAAASRHAPPKRLGTARHRAARRGRATGRPARASRKGRRSRIASRMCEPNGIGAAEARCRVAARARPPDRRACDGAARRRSTRPCRRPAAVGARPPSRPGRPCSSKGAAVPKLISAGENVQLPCRRPTPRQELLLT